MSFVVDVLGCGRFGLQAGFESRHRQRHDPTSPARTTNSSSTAFLSYSYWAEGNRTARFIDVNANGLLDAVILNRQVNTGWEKFVASSLILHPFCRPPCVLAASRLCVDVCSTCSSWRLERLTGSYLSGCRLRVWIEVGRNAADGTTERACYFAAVCTLKRKHRLTQRRQGAKTQRSTEVVGRGGWMNSYGRNTDGTRTEHG